jgi:hypothetical protein
MATACIPACGRAQQTVVRDAGGGRKIELTYNSSGQVVRTRTLSESGKLAVQVDYEYHPAFLVPQQTTTSYWPDGQTVRSVTRVTYDENGNFISEVTTTFDESGKPAGGHKLTHDPFTGIYQCSEQPAAGGKFRPVECPAGEQEGGGEKEWTYEEVARELEQARRIAARSPEEAPAAAGQPVELGLVLPSEIHAGETITASVIYHPSHYEGVAGVKVIAFRLPPDAPPELDRWECQVAGQAPRPASTPIRLAVPRGVSEFSIALRPVGSSGSFMESVKISPGSQNPQKFERFEGSPVCVKGGLCVIRGPFADGQGGDFAAIGGYPARILAETASAAYVSVPSEVAPGLTHLILATASRVIAMPVAITQLAFSPDHLSLRAGQTMLVHAFLSGPEQLPDDCWRAGIPPGLSPAEARRWRGSGFDPPGRGEGLLLVTIRNATLQLASLRGSQNQTFAFRLVPESFKHGEFKYQFVVQAAQSGTLALQSTIMPFLAPVPAQVYDGQLLLGRQ